MLCKHKVGVLRSFDKSSGQVLLSTIPLLYFERFLQPSPKYAAASAAVNAGGLFDLQRF